ncbi:hypothetical protein EON66_05715 [archaeon]|nr:MAG: hypothetical protein EON66_05715 [archaeon]
MRVSEGGLALTTHAMHLHAGWRACEHANATPGGVPPVCVCTHAHTRLDVIHADCSLLQNEEGSRNAGGQGEQGVRAWQPAVGSHSHHTRAHAHSGAAAALCAQLMHAGACIAWLGV